MPGFGYRWIPAGWGMILFVAFLALVIVGITALVRYVRVTAHTHQLEIPDTASAVRILNERYARGELTDEEYRTKKKAILDLP